MQIGHKIAFRNHLVKSVKSRHHELNEMYQQYLIALIFQLLQNRVMTLFERC